MMPIRFLLFFVFLCLPLAAKADAVQVRGFIWGVGKQDVRQYEKAVFWEEGDDYLRFFEDIGNYRRVIEYDFRGNRLWRVHYDYSELTPPNPDIVMDMYYDQQRALASLYGEPSADRMTGRSGRSVRVRPENWGRFLYDGDLRLVSAWQILDTRITLQAYGEGQGFYKLFYMAEKAEREEDRTRQILRLPGQE